VRRGVDREGWTNMRNKIADTEASALNLLLEKVYRDSGHDFREYKCGTVMRRLQRRLQATGARTYQEYIGFMDTHPEEHERLTDYLTIHVSSFFRNAYTFRQVASLVLPELVSHKRERRQRSLRFWSTACTRGEEPYSIAMMLTEFLGQKLPDFNISIYATDISWRSLHEAQSGQYPLKDVETLSSTILENYFNRQGGNYVIASSIRRMVNFSYFDLVSTKTPPFMNLDCIFCCNILIYLQKQLQERVLNMLYNSLATPGYLVLGEVETPTDDLRMRTECLGTKAKIYKKTGRIP